LSATEAACRSIGSVPWWSRSIVWLIFAYSLREFHAAGITVTAMAISASAIRMLAMLVRRSTQ
jgi:hypothetical protein